VTLLTRVAKYLFGIYALDKAPQIAKTTSLAEAVHFLKKQYRFFRPAPVRFLTRLYRYLLETADLLPKLDENNTFILHLCCWGKEYCAKVTRYLLPSLLSEGNLPTAAKEQKVTLLIHCDELSSFQLQQSLVLEHVKKYASVELIVLPEPLITAYNSCLRYPSFSFFKKIKIINAHLRYFLLGALQSQALDLALKSQSYISFLMPDLVLSKKFLSNAFLMLENKKIVAATAFRSDYNKVVYQLDRYFTNQQKTELVIPAEVLKDLQVNHMHAASKRTIISEETLNFAPCAHLLFESEKGFILRSFHYHPVLLDCSRHQYKIKKDYYPIDGAVLNQILSDDLPVNEQVVVCCASSEVVFMELSDRRDTIAESAQKSDYKVMLRLVYNMLQKHPDVYNTPLSRYYSSVRNCFESSTYQREKNITVADDQFFADLEIRLL